MKVLTVVGARPQLIKLAAFDKAVNNRFEHIVVHTGQHYDNSMSGSFFVDLDMSLPAVNLNISGGSNISQVSKMSLELEKTFHKIRPDVVNVFGDTNSTLAASFVASSCRIPIVHIEAGLRSRNMSMPEERNRVITDHISDLLCAPTITSLNNLENENLKNKAVFTGDIMVDSLELVKKKLERVPFDDFYLCTIHRPSNVDNMERLIGILDEIGKLEKMVVLPLHPRAKMCLSKIRNIPSNLHVTEPMGYLEFQSYLSSSIALITDSGGAQKEAYMWRKPCFTLRNETEWIETVESGWNTLISGESGSLKKSIQEFEKPDSYPLLYGHNCAEKIISAIITHFS